MPENVIQTFVPASVQGRMTMVTSRRKGTISPADAARIEIETRRRMSIARRREYYAGTQFDAENAEEQRYQYRDGRSAANPVVPEHRRLHAYSTQIQECVDFLANRLGAGFTIAADQTPVQDVIDAMVVATDTIYAPNAEGDIEIVTDDVLREALMTGDTPVYVGWDPVEERPYLEFWESEAVEFVPLNRTEIEMVIRYDWVWMTDPVTGVERQVEERLVYRMEGNAFGIAECVVEVYLEDDEAPRSREWTGLGRIPWQLLRSDAKGLRSLRGEALITEQAMAMADRYNAVEQTGYLIARYNSHSNVAVIGDAASLKLESDGRVSKDVADVLTFPGGTALQVLTLPTSPEMIEHQRAVLSEALHGVFGVTRVDPETLQGLGQVSGYALEILNQKSEGTYSRVARNWRKDWVRLIDLVLDVTAWKRDAQFAVLDVATMQMRPFTPPADDEMMPQFAPNETPVALWWEVDPRIVFPNRRVGIRMGSGYIVDDVKVRDDFVAGLISRQEALRLRGYDDPDIVRIVDEIDDAADKEMERAAPEVGVYGVGPVAPSSVKSGSTLAGDTDSPATQGVMTP